MSPEAADLGGPGIILNLAGEGELDRAIDINSLVFPLRRPEQWVRPGRFILADITALPVRGEAAVEVVGRKLPMMSDEDRLAVVREAARVLVAGGTSPPRDERRREHLASDLRSHRAGRRYD